MRDEILVYDSILEQILIDIMILESDVSKFGAKKLKRQNHQNFMF